MKLQHVEIQNMELWRHLVVVFSMTLADSSK